MSDENPFQRFEERRIAREARRMAVNKMLAEINAEGERDAIAVAQLRLVYPNGFPSAPSSPEPDAIEPAPTPPATAAEKMQASAEMTVKDMALAVLKDAYPHGLSAAQIKGKAFLKFRKHLNPNTLTVSLIRLKPKVVCEGRTWYYQREGGERQRLNDIWKIGSENEKPRVNGASKELPEHTP